MEIEGPTCDGVCGFSAFSYSPEVEKLGVQVILYNAFNPSHFLLSFSYNNQKCNYFILRHDPSLCSFKKMFVKS
jgi:hypothetical protein